MGIPTRYVSGYLHPDAKAEIGKTVTGQSHAWVEWWDGAWVPFDPTNAASPSQSHVVVGRGRDYRDVPPVKGRPTRSPEADRQRGLTGLFKVTGFMI